MKTLICISIIVLFLLSCATISNLSLRSSYPESVKTLIKLALSGEKNEDGDWINSKSKQYILTVFYIEQKYVGIVIGDGFSSYGGYYQISAKTYVEVMAMAGQIVGAQEISKEDFDNLVKEFMTLWDTPKIDKAAYRET
jgi:hypothetical protein